MATERYRKNVISQIVDASGRMVTDHGEKSALFYQEFKRRLGTTTGISMQFDLQSMARPNIDLEHLCLPFSPEKIDGIILDLPMTKPRGLMALTVSSSRKLGPLLSTMYINFVGIFTITKLISRVSITHTSPWFPRRITLKQ